MEVSEKTPQNSLDQKVIEFLKRKFHDLNNRVSQLEDHINRSQVAGKKSKQPISPTYPINLIIYNWDYQIKIGWLVGQLQKYTRKKVGNIEYDFARRIAIVPIMLEDAEILSDKSFLTMNFFQRSYDFRISLRKSLKYWNYSDEDRVDEIVRNQNSLFVPLEVPKSPPLRKRPLKDVYSDLNELLRDARHRAKRPRTRIPEGYRRNLNDSYQRRMSQLDQFDQ